MRTCIGFRISRKKLILAELINCIQGLSSPEAQLLDEEAVREGLSIGIVAAVTL
jgi:hypothetical protein